jgi:transposase InsO family protein
VIDDFNREALCIEVDVSLPASRVKPALEQVIEWRGKPAMIRCDNGPEYISEVLKAWAAKQEITLGYIQPGNPQQNAYLTERYVTIGWLIICLARWRSAKSLQHNGCGFITMSGPIWRWMVIPQSSIWQRLHDLYF